MRLACAAIVVSVVACADDEAAGPIDASPLDAAIDAPALDAAFDASLIDVAPDTALDAPALDAAIDAAPDAPLAAIDAPAIDTPAIDAPAPFTASNGASGADLIGVFRPISVPDLRVFILDSDDGSIESTTMFDPSATPTEVRPPGEGVLAGIRFRVADQGPGRPDLALWATTRFDVSLFGIARVTGARAAIILSREEIGLWGIVGVRAGCARCGGPGGGDGGLGGGAALGPVASGCAPGGAGHHDIHGPGHGQTGGAGGGLGTPGGPGGAWSSADGALVISGGPAAPLDGCPGANLIPLVGGSGGGAGGVDIRGVRHGGHGGGGGGALQLSSLVAIEIIGPATLEAPGWGGQGSPGGGGGGGAGGALLLEAPVVTIDGTVTANGGGGGSGCTSSDGEGSWNLWRGRGGDGCGIRELIGRGGAGGIAADTTAPDLLPEPGYSTTALTGGNGGGGGGAAGRIRINTAPGSPPHIGPGATVSPPPSIGVLGGG